MFLGNVYAMPPKSLETQSFQTNEVKVSYSDEDRLEKLKISIENLKSTININEESIAKAKQAIIEHEKSIDKLNKKKDKYSTKNFSKKKISKIEKNIEIHQKIIANLKQTIDKVNSENEKCKISIKNLNTVIEYFK